MDKLKINIKKNKENYLIIASILFLILALAYSCGQSDLDNDNALKTKSENTVYVPTLEEIAQQEGKDISEYMPKPKTVPTLEEIAQKEGKDISEYMPQPKDASSLEKLNN